jgi:hypothetical protein
MVYSRRTRDSREGGREGGRGVKEGKKTILRIQVTKSQSSTKKLTETKEGGDTKREGREEEKRN